MIHMDYFYDTCIVLFFVHFFWVLVTINFQSMEESSVNIHQNFYICVSWKKFSQTGLVHAESYHMDYSYGLFLCFFVLVTIHCMYGRE